MVHLASSLILCHLSVDLSACAYDGGDCCPQTCEILDYSTSEEDDFDATAAALSGRCLWKNFACRDPDALTVTVVGCEAPNERHLRSASRFFDRDAFLLAWKNRTSMPLITSFQKTRLLGDGDGVAGNGICDPLLNNEDNFFDGGYVPTTATAIL